LSANHRHLRTNPVSRLVPNRRLSIIIIANSLACLLFKNDKNNAAFELLDQLEYQYSNPRPVALKGEEEAKKIHLSRFLKKTETANEDDGEEEEEEEEDTNGGEHRYLHLSLHRTPL
jgi:hypothetical protein